MFFFKLGLADCGYFCNFCFYWDWILTICREEMGICLNKSGAINIKERIPTGYNRGSL